MATNTPRRLPPAQPGSRRLGDILKPYLLWALALAACDTASALRYADSVEITNLQHKVTELENTVEALAELKAEVDELKAEVDELKADAKVERAIHE